MCVESSADMFINFTNRISRQGTSWYVRIRRGRCAFLSHLQYPSLVLLRLLMSKYPATGLPDCRGGEASKSTDGTGAVVMATTGPYLARRNPGKLFFQTGSSELQHPSHLLTLTSRHF